MTVSYSTTRPVALLLLLVLAACATPPAAPPTPAAAPATQPADSTPLVIPTATPGRSVVTGRVFSLSRNQPLSFTIVRLAQVFRRTSDGQVLENDGAYLLDGARSPAAATNEQGLFVFVDVDPLEYVLVIGEAEGVNALVTEQSGRAKVWEAIAGDVLDVGEVRVNYP